MTRNFRDDYQEKGLIDAGERIRATDEGRSALGDDYQPLPTGSALRDHVLRTLPEGERRVLEFLISHYPNAVQRHAIDHATGYKRSSRDAYLQRLTARELIDSSRSDPAAAEELFD